MTPAEQAWVVKEHLAGRSQKDISIELDVSQSVICSAVMRFCLEWAEFNVQTRRAYGEDRRKVSLIALGKYFFRTSGEITKPAKRLARRSYADPHPAEVTIQEYALARREHAWLLRAEGLKLREVGMHMGCSGDRARQLIFSFGRRVAHAMRRVRIFFDEVA